MLAAATIATVTPQRHENMYAVPQRLEYKPDLKAALVEKYSEPQYQNVPNDLMLRRKSSVDANTMTSWQQNGMPVSKVILCKLDFVLNKFVFTVFRMWMIEHPEI